MATGETVSEIQSERPWHELSWQEKAEILQRIEEANLDTWKRAIAEADKLIPHLLPRPSETGQKASKPVESLKANTPGAAESTARKLGSVSFADLPRRDRLIHNFGSDVARTAEEMKALGIELPDTTPKMPTEKAVRERFRDGGLELVFAQSVLRA